MNVKADMYSVEQSHIIQSQENYTKVILLSFLPTFIRNNSACDKILKYFGNQIAVVVSRVS